MFFIVVVNQAVVKAITKFAVVFGIKTLKRSGELLAVGHKDSIDFFFPFQVLRRRGIFVDDEVPGSSYLIETLNNLIFGGGIHIIKVCDALGLQIQLEYGIVLIIFIIGLGGRFYIFCMLGINLCPFFILIQGLEFGKEIV